MFAVLITKNYVFWYFDSIFLVRHILVVPLAVNVIHAWWVRIIYSSSCHWLPKESSIAQPKTGMDVTFHLCRFKCNINTVPAGLQSISWWAYIHAMWVVVIMALYARHHYKVQRIVVKKKNDGDVADLFPNTYALPSLIEPSHGTFPFGSIGTQKKHSLLISKITPTPLSPESGCAPSSVGSASDSRPTARPHCDLCPRTPRWTSLGTCTPNTCHLQFTLLDIVRGGGHRKNVTPRQTHTTTVVTHSISARAAAVMLYGLWPQPGVQTLSGDRPGARQVDFVGR